MLFVDFNLCISKGSTKTYTFKPDTEELQRECQQVCQEKNLSLTIANESELSCYDDILADFCERSHRRPNEIVMLLNGDEHRSFFYPGDASYHPFVMHDRCGPHPYFTVRLVVRIEVDMIYQLDNKVDFKSKKELFYPLYSLRQVKNRCIKLSGVDIEQSEVCIEVYSRETDYKLIAPREEEEILLEDYENPSMMVRVTKFEERNFESHEINQPNDSVDVDNGNGSVGIFDASLQGFSAPAYGTSVGRSLGSPGSFGSPTSMGMNSIDEALHALHTYDDDLNEETELESNKEQKQQQETTQDTSANMSEWDHSNQGQSPTPDEASQDESDDFVFDIKFEVKHVVNGYAYLFDIMARSKGTIGELKHSVYLKTNMAPSLQLLYSNGELLENSDMTIGTSIGRELVLFEKQKIY